jgi:transposase
MTPRRQQLEQPNRRRSTYQTSKAVQTNRATSLIENCKLSDINPHEWLTKTMTALANGYPANRVHELMPWIYVG